MTGRVFCLTVVLARPARPAGAVFPPTIRISSYRHPLPNTDRHMRHNALLFAIIAAALLALAACDDAGACETDGDCFAGEYCLEGRCAPSPANNGGTYADDEDARTTEDTASDDADEPDGESPADTSDTTAQDSDDDTTQNRPEVIEIAAGGLHTCAILSSGEVMCWGSNVSGALGHNEENATNEDTPVFVAGITDATSLDGGHLHSCAIQGQDTLWCWGSNGSEQIASGASTAIYAPMSVGLTGVAQVEAGDSHTCARLDDGDGDCWSNVTAVNGVPPELGAMSDLAAGFRHSCGIISGEVHCWGRDFEDQLGDGSPVSGISNASDVVAGREHSCTLLQSGEVKCWGRNGSGQLGDGSNQNSASPVAVEGLEDAVQIGAGQNHNCALSEGGAVSCWGDDGESVNSAAPDGIFGLNSGVQQITVGGHHACALRDSGEVVCWGLGRDGQLGDGRSRSSSRPVTVDFPL